MEAIRADLIIADETAARPEQSYLSFEDFLKQYDGVRAEWYKGEVEVLMGNNVLHNQILGFLLSVFNLYLGFGKIGQVLLAGVAMYTGDEWPSREPDLMIVLNENRERIKPTYLDGPADIVIEIVSPESVERDYGAKFQQYEAVGIREYWRFDPLRKLADIYVRGDNDLYHRGLLDDEGRIISSLLPGFALDPDILWREELPSGMELIQLAQGMAGNPTN
ncbi:MAG: Uma2 family endonuclease [Chitinophagaceae bacterium]|nr:Uma2 family endonuclease [Anaerolineae bacterium]